MAEYLKVKSWDKLQHYRDRSPPWIKLHRDLLRDYEFSCLHDASKLQLMLLWLLASQLDNKVPNDPDWIQKQLCVDAPLDLKPLIEQGFIVLAQDDSTVLADCKQSAMLETETETETETEGKASAPASPKRPFADEFEPLWKAYPKRDGSNPKKKALSAYTQRRKAGVPHEAMRAGLERYAKWCEAKGRLGTEYVMTAARFFGPGEEWESPWNPDGGDLPRLPFDNQTLWQIRKAIKLQPIMHTGDAKACHAEINQYLAKHPEHRPTVQQMVGA